MKIASYEFSEGARFQKDADLNPKAVGEHLDMLRQKFKGELTPQRVLDDARHDNSPLHSFFEWSDSAAANQYRLQQARGLIRSVVAVYVGGNKQEIRQRAYIHISTPSPHYREAIHALSQTETRKLVLDRAMNELNAWRARYKDLEEFASFIDIIDRIHDGFPEKLQKIGGK
jgi:hypothetical protein